MKDVFYRITRSISWNSDKPRYTEIRVTGHHTDTGAERITGCCGKSVPYKAKQSKKAADKAA